MYSSILLTTKLRCTQIQKEIQNNMERYHVMCSIIKKKKYTSAMQYYSLMFLLFLSEKSLQFSF